MKTIQISLAVVIGALVALFAIGNMAMIDVSFVGFTVRTPLIVLILALITAGFVLGKIVRILPKPKVRHRESSPSSGRQPYRTDGEQTKPVP